MPDDVMFNEALGAIEKGEKIRARDLLTRYLKSNPQDAAGWIWMSAVVDTPREITYCLQEALKRDPNNSAARQGLVLLGAHAPEESSVPVIVKRKWQAKYLPESAESSRLGLSWWRIALPAAAGLIVIALVIAGIAGINGRARPTVYRPPSTQGPTSTYLPSTTPVVRSPTPTFVGPTPLWMLLNATYTPTPLYVNTPHPITEAYRTGIRAFQRGDLNGLITDMQQLTTSEPSSADGLYYIGEAYRLQKDYADALKAYNLAIAVNESFAPAYLGRARVERVLDPKYDPEPDLTKAISLDPNLAEAYLEEADVAINLGQSDQALQDVDSAEKLLPSSPLVPYYRAEANLSLGKPDLALTQAQTANNLDLTFLPGYLLLGKAFQANGKFQESISPLETYTLYQPDDPLGSVLLGTAYAAAGRDQDAVTALTQALKLDNQSLEAYQERGLVYLDLKDGKSAYADFLAGIQINTKSFAARLGLGRALLLMGNKTDAYNELNLAGALAASDIDRASLYYWRATVLESSGNLPAAWKDWSLLLALPDSVVPPDWASQARQSLAAIPTITPTVTNSPTRTPVPSKTPTAPPVTPSPVFHP